MTDLRDARFKRALDHAPDAELRPDPATRQAIRSMATRALETRASGTVSKAAPSTWWRRAWHGWIHPSAGASPMPWNAALATVLLASLVTVLWYEQPVPQAIPDDAPRQGAGGRGVADPAALPPAASAPAPGVTVGPGASPAREIGQSAALPKRDVGAGAPPASLTSQSVAKAVPPSGLIKSERAAAPEAPPGESPVRAADLGKDQAAKKAPSLATVPVPQAPQPGAASVGQAAPAPVIAPAPSPSWMPAPAAPKAALARPEVALSEPQLARQRADADRATPSMPVRTDWSDLSVQRAGSPLVLSSVQASRLLALVQRVSLQSVEAGPAEAPALSTSIHLDLSRRGAQVASLELGERWVLWTPAGATHPSLAGRASAVQWEAIQAELARLGLLTP